MKTPRKIGSADISGANLAFLLDVKPEMYASAEKRQEFRDNRRNLEFKASNESILCAVAEALSFGLIKGVPTGTRKVSKGNYLSGEVWRDNHYEGIYLYVGKVADMDVVMGLAGIYLDDLTFATGYINKGKEKIFFDERIFPK